MLEKPVYALSVRQPCAWLLCRNIKTCENRRKPFPAAMGGHPVQFPIRLFIHAALKAFSIYEATMFYKACERWQPGWESSQDKSKFWEVVHDPFFKGAIIGEVTVVKTSFRLGEENDALYSPWHWPGYYGYYTADGNLYDEFIPCKGQLGIWKAEIGNG